MAENDNNKTTKPAAKKTTKKAGETKSKKTGCKKSAVKITKTTKTTDKVKPAAKKTTSKKKADSNIVLMKTNIGSIKIELNPEKAPITVENFMRYVKEGFYKDLVFHRVIDGFMIQGGGFDNALQHKASHEPIKIESDNGLKNERGTIAMARTQDPNSATSQFFINLVDNGFLDYKAPTIQGYGYAVFGKVIDGMDVVDKIGSVPTGMLAGMQDVPKYVILIEDIEVL